MSGKNNKQPEPNEMCKEPCLVWIKNGNLYFSDEKGGTHLVKSSVYPQRGQE